MATIRIVVSCEFNVPNEQEQFCSL